MALTINYKITGSIDGSYINIQATNPESDYIDEGISIDGDLDSIDLDLTINNQLMPTVQFSQEDSLLILTSGLKVYPTTFGIESFDDGIYYGSYTAIVSAALGTYLSESTIVLYGITEQSALKFIFDTDWKNSYKDINIYFDNSLKVKSWLNNIKLSNDADLPNEGYRILKSLQKAIL